MGYTIKKNEISPFAGTGMELESSVLTEVSQAQKDKYQMFSLICGSFYDIDLTEAKSQCLQEAGRRAKRLDNRSQKYSLRGGVSSSVLYSAGPP